MDPPSGSDSNWIEERIDELIEQYGAVPPPWFMIPDTHPHEIGWRMGAGEAHIMVFSSWWEKEKADLDEEAKIEYFRKWPPPPRWLVWMIEVLWDIRPWESSSDQNPSITRLISPVRKSSALARKRTTRPTSTIPSGMPETVLPAIGRDILLPFHTTE